MFQLNKLVRLNIQALKPYSSARDEFKGKEGIFLDANENPFGNLNRYPDPHQKKLKEKLSILKNIPTENIFIGNGSDEVIDLAYRVFCVPGKDKVIICPPTYGMYEFSADVNGVETIKIPLDENFQLQVEKILQAEAKLIFLCSPNNPTGNSLINIEKILKNFKGIVMVDEAYIDFSKQNSLLSKISQYPNLIVSQTLSKAWGKAAIRVGIAYASKEIINYYSKVKPPYNVSEVNQIEAIKALDNLDFFNANKAHILTQKKWLIEQLSNIALVEKIYPSDANFILIKTKDANAVYQKFINDKIVVRNRHTVIENCIRITVGEASENLRLIESIRKINL
ncbi:MAG: histidinol-phosphate transaminase [Bacteroidia bacterium]|nr:histidinol-phosphate transaminase [Bacteroidia bacterium]